jgi:HAD superfamily hydrolase (TIGR01549 family)
MIRAVVFDVGECLVDETREYGTWADWLGVPRHTFAAMFGAVISQGRDYRETFQVFRPGFDLYEQREARAVAGKPETFAEEDLYSDVRPALAELRAAGLWLGIAGNQTVRAGGILRELFTGDVDLIGTSDDWGASKPDPEFFERVAEAVPFEVGEILYVGDRVDNDIRPADPARALGDDPVGRGRGEEAADDAHRQPPRSSRPYCGVQLSALTVVPQPYSCSSRSRTHRSCCHGVRARRTSRMRSMPVAYQLAAS